ncbi:hypothetical protein B0J12DRAFT_1281 [Macrophomina phaseolina]|uniref:Uncharacterized protein n=1 Tax=Macrophomina phaseolina TaxID=35725 RepID=A0ABQ8GTD8_9PEZI|nr:hypothetical protein B0J12DRAFT_1281 [Macrophomina phaseolina]
MASFTSFWKCMQKEIYRLVVGIVRFREVFLFFCFCYLFIPTRRLPSFLIAWASCYFFSTREPPVWSLAAYFKAVSGGGSGLNNGGRWKHGVKDWMRGQCPSCQTCLLSTSSRNRKCGLGCEDPHSSCISLSLPYSLFPGLERGVIGRRLSVS